jgi:hypothetical protein
MPLVDSLNRARVPQRFARVILVFNQCLIRECEIDLH